jgi:hypothetical protein
MAQIQSPETYVDGQQVTATRLNNQTNGATLIPGAITDQTALAAGTVATGDQVLLHDASASALRRATAGDLLGSNVPVTTSAVTAGANNDIVITPNNGTIVTGQAYTSANGLTVTVTSTAHILVVGQVILVSAAATGYNGTFRVATVATNSFTYVMTTAATPGSSTLSYTKLGSIRNAGSESITGSLFVTGSASAATSAVSGNSTVGGNSSVGGNLDVTGTTTLTGVATATTAAALTNTTQIATTQFVRADNNVKAWVNFNGTGTVAIRASFNVSSITDNGVGDYTVNFTTALADANYATLISCSSEVNGQHAVAFLGQPNTDPSATYLAASCRFSFYSAANFAATADKAYVNAIFIR